VEKLMAAGAKRNRHAEKQGRMPRRFAGHRTMLVSRRPRRV